jgi:hypothetical protein
MPRTAPDRWDGDGMTKVALLPYKTPCNPSPYLFPCSAAAGILVLFLSSAHSREGHTVCLSRSSEEPPVQARPHPRQAPGSSSPSLSDCLHERVVVVINRRPPLYSVKLFVSVSVRLPPRARRRRHQPSTPAIFRQALRPPSLCGHPRRCRPVSLRTKQLSAPQSSELPAFFARSLPGETTIGFPFLLFSVACCIWHFTFGFCSSMETTLFRY